MVGAGQRLRGGGGGADSLQAAAGLWAAAALGVSLQDVHQVGDKKVVLQRRHALLRQDGRLPAHRAG